MLKWSKLMSWVSDWTKTTSLEKTSRFSLFPSAVLELKRTGSRASTPQKLRVLWHEWNWADPMTFLSLRYWELKAAAHSFSNSESAEKLPLGKKWVLSVAGTHFRYLTNGKKKKVKPTLFLHKRPSFCCDAFLIQQPKVEKWKMAIFSLIDYVHSIADSKLKILGWWERWEMDDLVPPN